MTAQATYDDVNLILRLYELRREDKLRAAREWFMKNFHARTMAEFQKICPQGSQENAYFRMVVSYWDMAASFVASGVLNEELFFHSGGELLFVLERVRELLPEFRQMMKNPRILSNAEQVGSSYVRWMTAQSPEWHATFAAMVRTMPAEKQAETRQ